MFRNRVFLLFCYILLSLSLIKCQDDDNDGDDNNITPTIGSEAEEVQRNPKNVFLELIRQRFSGNRVQQCPCVTLPGTDKCIAYDPRYAAVSPEEAAVAFSDLTSDNFDTFPFRKQDYNCTTPQCIQCSALLFYRLKEINFISENYTSRFSFDLPRLRELRPRNCSRLWMTRRRHLRSPPTLTPDYVQRMIDEGEKFVDDYSRFPSTEYSSKVTQTLNAQDGPQYTTSLTGQQPTYISQTVYQPVGELGNAPSLTQFPGFQGPAQFPPFQGVQSPPFIGPPSPPGFFYPPIGGGGGGIPRGMLNQIVAEKVALLSLLGKKRRKRNTPDVSGKNLIGERFVISCVEKGDAESDETDFLNLCTSCWAWRKLPDNYFPQIINELVCQENDFCLSGWGSCTQRYRHVDVLHKQNGSWVPTTVVSGACCDCKIRAGTEVHQLVIGNTRREHRQVDTIIGLAYRETVDRNIPPIVDKIDDHPLPKVGESTSLPPTTSETTLFPPGEINIFR